MGSHAQRAAQACATLVKTLVFPVYKGPDSKLGNALTTLILM